MNNLKRRVLSFLLCMCMVLNTVPMYAFAEETASDVQQSEFITVETEADNENSGENSDANSEEIIVESEEEATEESEEKATEESEEKAAEESEEEAAEESEEEAAEESEEKTTEESEEKATEESEEEAAEESEEEVTEESEEKAAEESEEEVTEESEEEAAEESEEEAAEESKEEAAEESKEEAAKESKEEAAKESEEAPVEPVKYTVKHYLWNWDKNDYVLLETEELTGMPGELTDAKEKSYEGCILEEEFEQVKILEDGTTVVEIKYIKLLEEAVAYAGTKLYDTSVSNEYFKVISEDTYDLAPGAVEHEIVLNNAEGNDRKVVHIFEVDTKNEDLEVMPGYYGIDKLNPDNLAGDKDRGVWTDKQLSQTVKYYEDELNYNVVGAMNTALAYDSNAPYGYMVWNGVELGNPTIHKGAQTYLAIDWDGNSELRSMSTPLTGNEKTAIPANFGWLVKDGKLTSTSVERTSSDASRSMVGVKADGTLIFCQVDGRNGSVSSGLSNYEMGEMMLALGCVNAFNCDGGGSSTFISKRTGESANVMRSVPSDGSERATINSVILVSTAGATGIFAKAQIETDYNYIAPTASMDMTVIGLDTKGFTMDVPADVTYKVAEEGMGIIADGVFTAGSKTGTATIQAVYNGEVVGTKVINVVHPDNFGFTAETTALPMDKTLALELFATYGVDDWNVCIDGSYTMTLPKENLGSSLNGNVMTPPSDPAMEMKTVVVTVTYNPDPTKTDTIAVMFGEASKVIWSFENGDRAGFMGFEEAKKWSIDNNISNTLIGADPLAGQFNEYLSSETKIVTAADGGQVKNGQYALAWTLDNTDTNFANWSYNVLFNVGEKVVLRDTANGNNATSLGMWLYIPEGAAGLAFQSQLWATMVSDGSTGCKQAHFTFVTNSGVRKNLNSCTEADIPASRWVYASIDLTPYSYCATMDPQETASNSRSPSFIRTYVKPNSPAVHTFYIDDITLDYSSAVDDRVAPVIGELQYATQDTTLPVEGTTLNTNSATFSAIVSDNTSLNTESAQIYIDGNKVDTQVQGKNMFTSEAVVMDNGSHVVTFEIADKMNNMFQTSARFTVAYAGAEQEKGLVYVTGHNDSGELAEAGSVYYIDLKTSDIAQIDNVELNIKLNNANTWELEHADVAEGFSYEYEVLSFDNRYETFAAQSDIHSTDNVAVITIKKVDNCPLTGEQTLISMPVRLWYWDGWDYVNNKPIDAFANKPIVTIDYNVLFGVTETVDGEIISFGGSDSIATKMNATDAVLHVHDEKLTVRNKEATCTVKGYENRTYCEGCKSVIDWGTKVEAAGHNYAIVNDQLVCECGNILSGTGIVEANGKVYCLIAGKIVTGWQSVGDKWCYADPTTKEVKTGEFTLNKITYTAGEDGLLVSGTWVEDFLGKRYSYGPDFYKRCFVTIDGEEYYFAEKTGYALTGYNTLPDNRNNPNSPVRWYHFAEDGKLIERMTMTGVLDTGNGLFYMEEGCVTFAGMVKVGDDYYCVADKKGTVLTGYNWVGSYIMENSKNPMPTGYYEFAEDGKLLQGIVVKEDGTYYYEMGKPVDAGWVKDGDDYYVFVNGGKAMVGRNWVGTYLTQKSKDPYKSGNFIFDKDGKLVNGVAEFEDGWYYCVAGVAKEAGLVCIDGQYYYADKGGKLATGRIYVGTYPSHGLLPIGKYEFGENGAMLQGVIKKADGMYYYDLGNAKYLGLIESDGEYYFVTANGKLATGRVYVGTYDAKGIVKPAYYLFGEDGAMFNGIESLNEGLYYYEMGTPKYCGLKVIGSDLYYIEEGGKVMTGRVYVGTYASNGLLPNGYYTFDTEGRFVK